MVHGTVNCETKVPSVGPIVHHLPLAVGPIFPKPTAPVEEVPAEEPATEEAPVEEPTAPAVATGAVYHKGFYAGLGSAVNHYWGHPRVWGHHGVLAHPVVDHVNYAKHGLGGYATGPVDVNSDGGSYTGPEDDRSPIAGGPVYHTLEGEAKWHGPYQGPVVHAPVGGYGAHHVLPHHPLGHLAYSHHSAIAHPGIVTGHSAAGVVTHHGAAVAFKPHLPASTHFGVVNAHDLLHRKLGDYTIGDIEDLKKDDCAPGVSAVLFDKSEKSADAEASPVADAAPEEVSDAKE